MQAARRRVAKHIKSVALEAVWFFYMFSMP